MLAVRLDDDDDDEDSIGIVTWNYITAYKLFVSEELFENYILFRTIKLLGGG